MARPIYPHELSDPDFQWLVNSYRESRGEVAVVDMSCLPLVMIKLDNEPRVSEDSREFTPLLPGQSADFVSSEAETPQAKK